jgi:hypothetical protein
VTTTVYKIHTITGSEYVIIEFSDGKFFMSGNNVVTAQSKDISMKFWRIERPISWPPREGQEPLYSAPKELPFDSKDRMPGGGKHISKIVKVDIIQGQEAA